MTARWTLLPRGNVHLLPHAELKLSVLHSPCMLLIAGLLCVLGRGEHFSYVVYLNCKHRRGKEIRGKATADTLRRAHERLHNGHSTTIRATLLSLPTSRLS